MRAGITNPPVHQTFYEYLPPPITDGTPGVDAVAYVGYSNFGTETNEPGWRIIKYTLVGTVCTPTYAGCTQDFTQIWDNRTTIQDWSR